MDCLYCSNLVEGKTYKVEGDGFCVGCNQKIFSDGITVKYSGLLRGFHRFQTQGMSICGNCGFDLSEMTLPCSEVILPSLQPVELDYQGE